jgi:hypothetical protein
LEKGRKKQKKREEREREEKAKKDKKTEKGKERKREEKRKKGRKKKTDADKNRLRKRIVFLLLTKSITLKRKVQSKTFVYQKTINHMPGQNKNSKKTILFNIQS